MYGNTNRNFIISSYNIEANYDYIQCFLTNKRPNKSPIPYIADQMYAVATWLFHIFDTILIPARIQCVETTLMPLVNFLITKTTHIEHWREHAKKMADLMKCHSIVNKYIHTFHTRIKSQLYPNDATRWSDGMKCLCYRRICIYKSKLMWWLCTRKMSLLIWMLNKR